MYLDNRAKAVTFKAMPKPKKNEEFARAVAKLNPAQRLAVESIEGPVMVVAGPGTGKTQVVALRIAQILTKTQLNARNILALTFTEAGVTALRKRLERFIGPDAYQVTIATFHGFANEVITTFPYVFGFAVEATQISELERLQLIHQIIEKKTDLTALRPLRAPTFHVPSIAEAIRKAKQENVEPAILRRLAQEEAADRLKAKKLTQLQRQTIDRTRQLNVELTVVYEEYQKSLKERNLYDYEDMILFAVRVLSTEPDVRAYYQERYQYFLVDEYQDTNNAQNALVEALAEYFPNPNLCVVGDDKQAIYRFQGASVANMLHFARKYPHLKIISLEENYRSAPPILAAAGDLIARNQHQLINYLKDIRPKLSPTRDAKRCQLSLDSFPTEETQFDWIVTQIEQRHTQGVPYEDIAVLFRRNDEVKAFREYALKKGLSVAGVETSNLINEPEIQQLLVLLRSVANPADPTLLFPALNLVSPLSPISLALLAQQFEKSRNLSKALAALSLTNEEQELIRSAVRTIEGWAADERALGLAALVETIVCNSRLLTAISQRTNSLERLELLKAFLNEVKRFSVQHLGSSLADFLGYITLLRNYRVRLPIHRLSPTVEGVFVATVHGAKGLEFETVFLPNVSNNIWTDRTKRELIKLPSTIAGLSSWDESPTEDERRLFYVALTRAKNCLFASYARFNEEGRELLPSQFMAEIEQYFDRHDREISPKLAKQILTTTLSPPSPIVLRQAEKKVVKELITENPFSYTDYQTYKKCPKQYLLNCVLRFPTRSDARLLYGSMVHRALELFFKQYRTRKQLPSQQALVGYLEQAARQTELFQGKKAVVTGAERLLRAYYRHIEKTAVVPVGVEYSFRGHHVTLENIWLTGKFDRIDPIDPLARTVRVVDYKTGSQAKTRNQIEGKTKAADDNLKQQLVFYALLSRLDRHFPFVATEFSLLFLDDKHSFREETFKVTADETDTLAKDIVKTYQEILSLDLFEHSRESFDEGCELCEIFAELA